MKRIENFEELLKKAHPDLRLMSPYINRRTKVLIRDQHGLCSMWPQTLLKGSRPSLKSAINKTTYGKSKLKEVHGDTYQYDKVNITNRNDKIIVTCEHHGDFEQTYYNHIMGRGCPKCKHITFDKEKEMTVYEIECYSKEECFIKIGCTSRNLKTRFSGSVTMPYKYKILKTLTGPAIDMIKLEYRMHDKYRDFKYIPDIKFGGYTECYNMDIKNL